MRLIFFRGLDLCVNAMDSVPDVSSTADGELSVQASKEMV